MKTSSPVLKLRVVEIETRGIVQSIEGQAFIKHSNSNRYVELRPTNKILIGDILEVKKNSIVLIQVEGKSIIEIKSGDSDDWFIFENANRTKP